MSNINLARGWATFPADAIPDILTLWARLATPDLGFVPAPPADAPYHHLGRILNWAESVMGAQARVPYTVGETRSYVWDGGNTTILGWDGTWTPGRAIQITLIEDDIGIGFCRLSWDTGTGKPSRYLNLSALLERAHDCGDTPVWEAAA